MDDNPFSTTAHAADALASARRTTRIDYITTVLITGKDASGAPFREFTQTSTVNLHGCRIRTSFRILVGMLVTVECPKAGTSGKAVCIKVWDEEPGVAGHEIALQLIKPQNLWAVPNPPADWEIVAKNMAQGRAGQMERPARQPSPAAAAPRAPVTPPPLAPPAPPPVAVARPAPAAGVTTEQRLAEIERRSNQLVESVLDILRGQAEELTRNSLEELRQQVDALIQDSEGRLRHSLQQGYEQSAASLAALRTSLMDQMAARGAQLIRSTEESLRTRLRSPSTAEEKQSPGNASKPGAGKH
jgi:hypothetical protein